MGLSIVFNNNGEVTSVSVGGFPLPAQFPIVVGSPTDTSKEYSFPVTMTAGGTVNVKVVFDSDTQISGGNAYVGIDSEPDMSNPIPITKVS